MEGLADLSALVRNGTSRSCILARQCSGVAFARLIWDDGLGSKFRSCLIISLLSDLRVVASRVFRRAYQIQMKQIGSNRGYSVTTELIYHTSYALGWDTWHGEMDMHPNGGGGGEKKIFVDVPSVSPSIVCPTTFSSGAACLSSIGLLVH